MKTYAIGDIHGCYYTMLDIINKLPKDSRIIFLGDLVDKGLHSKKVVNYIIERNHDLILGNHDIYMMEEIEEYLNSGIPIKWAKDDVKYGSFNTISEYKNDRETLTKHINYLSKQDVYKEININDKNILLSHGFALPYYSQLKRTDEFNHLLYKSRLSSNKHKDTWDMNYQDFDVVNIFGHDTFKEVNVGPNWFGIDTGVIYNNKLTAISLNDFEIIQVTLNPKDFVSFDLKMKNKS